MFVRYMCITVKHVYREQAYNELMLTAKWFSFPWLSYYLVVNLTDITKYAYNEPKSPVPGTLL